MQAPEIGQSVLTVADLLALDEFRSSDVTVAAGGHRLGNRVEWVHVFETPVVSEVKENVRVLNNVFDDPYNFAVSVVAARNSLLRIASQALSTTEQTLAVVLDPPATGAGGKLESPSSTFTDVSGTPSRSAAIWPMTV